MSMTYFVPLAMHVIWLFCESVCLLLLSNTGNRTVLMMSLACGKGGPNGSTSIPLSAPRISRMTSGYSTVILPPSTSMKLFSAPVPINVRSLTGPTSGKN